MFYGQEVTGLQLYIATTQFAESIAIEDEKEARMFILGKIKGMEQLIRIIEGEEK